MHNTLILDCYTDEPSGYGVRPFLGSHQIHLSQALSSKGIDHKYLTIEDLRYGDLQRKGKVIDPFSRELLHSTNNRDQALELVMQAQTIYLIMGCFVEYEYFSSVPAKNSEIFSFLKNSKAKIILFYVMASENVFSDEYLKSELKTVIEHTEIGNTYRYILEESVGADFTQPNYDLLAKISGSPIQIIEQLRYPIIAEIETGTGCNTPSCTFCIEAARKHQTQYREPDDIIRQVKSLYNSGVRNFRLGRQPNFYHYQKYNVQKLEFMLEGIRSACPDLETLHIDNVNMIDVIRPHGEAFTQLITKYCTAGNIAPFGIESFDDHVRQETKVTGKADQIIAAMEVINKYGQKRGKNGFPLLLPGINLIYGLPGQTVKTHEINLEYLQKILDLGLQTQRLFYRRMTRSTGISFDEGPQETEEYLAYYQDIMESYVIPMQKRVYPVDLKLTGFREAIIQNGHTILRTLGTCSIRAHNKKSGFMKPYENYCVKVIGHIEPKLLDVQVISDNCDN